MRRLEHLLERSRTEPPRVLSVEDDADQAAFVRAVPESAGYRVRICADSKNLDTELSAFRPDLVLLDIQLPGADGFALARYIRQQEAHAALPILFLTTRSQIESQIESIRAGGDEYLVKPVAPGLLLSTAAARIERARFLRTLLERDGLTRLLTHTAFLERARALVAESPRAPKKPVALVLLDLDNFKSLNDRYGHPAGDRVLCSLAALLRRRVRQSDLLGRLGGDEFAAAVENIGEKQAVALLERLKDEFSAMDQVASDGSVFRLPFPPEWRSSNPAWTSTAGASRPTRPSTPPSPAGGTGSRTPGARISRRAWPAPSCRCSSFRARANSDKRAGARASTPGPS